MIFSAEYDTGNSAAIVDELFHRNIVCKIHFKDLTS